MTVERNANQTEPQALEANERRWEALEHRKRGTSYRDIAKLMGCSLGAAHNYVTDALEELKAKVHESAEQLREIEIQKLDRLEELMKESLEQEEDPVARGKVAAVIVKITESRRKLLGLDAPQKVEMSGNLYTVKEASPDCDAWGKPAQVQPNAANGEKEGQP